MAVLICNFEHIVSVPLDSNDCDSRIADNSFYGTAHSYFFKLGHAWCSSSSLKQFDSSFWIDGAVTYASADLSSFSLSGTNSMTSSMEQSSALQIRSKMSIVIFSSRYILLTVRWLTFACCSNFYIFSFQCSAAEICPQRTHAASQICFSKQIVALFPLAIE